MSKHTPGEWRRIGRLVYVLMPAGWSKGVEQFKNRITITVSHDRECPEEEAEACARLIAAAPDLLDLATALLSAIEMFAITNTSDEDTIGVLSDAAREVIDKAQGAA